MLTEPTFTDISLLLTRGSRPRYSIKKADLTPAILLKRDSEAGVLHVNSAKSLRTHFFYGTPGRWLLLTFLFLKAFKVGPSASKRICFICFNESLLKIMKMLLFCLKRSSCIQDIWTFVFTFCSCRKTA